jgi:hypothetical protein
MKILERIWNDIRRGENIDLYTTVAIALGLVILNVFGVASPPLTSSLTLAVLGLLALSNLGNRHSIEKLSEKLSQSTDMPFFIEEFSPNLKTDIENASELWLVGVTQTQAIRENYPRIEQLLRRGGTVKVLLVHPEGPALEMAASRRYVQLDAEKTRNEILGSLQAYCKLRQISSDRIEIRTIQNPLGHGIIAVNPHAVSGTLYIAYYPFRMAGGSRPKFILRTKDGNWYDLYRNELRMLWDNGLVWDCPKQES